MNPTALRTGQALTALAWLLVIINVLAPFPGQAHTVFAWLGLGMVVAHAIECVVFTPRIRAHAHGDPVRHYLLVFIFGYFHAITLHPKH